MLTYLHTQLWKLLRKTCHCPIQEEALQAKCRRGRRATSIFLQPISSGQLHLNNSLELEKEKKHQKKRSKGSNSAAIQGVSSISASLWRQINVTLNWYGAGKDIWWLAIFISASRIFILNFTIYYPFLSNRIPNTTTILILGYFMLSHNDWISLKLTIISDSSYLCALMIWGQLYSYISCPRFVKVSYGLSLVKKRIKHQYMSQASYHIWKKP